MDIWVGRVMCDVMMGDDCLTGWVVICRMDFADEGDG